MPTVTTATSPAASAAAYAGRRVTLAAAWNHPATPRGRRSAYARRTRTITRRSNDSSRRTGACSSWTSISSVVRPQSATVNLPQQNAQPITGAHDSHFQRRDPDTRDLRHLVVPQLLHVLQQERLALVSAQLAKGALDFLAPHRLFSRMLLRRIEQRGLVVNERLTPSHAPCPTRPTPIDEYAEQPGAEALGILAARQ